MRRTLALLSAWALASTLAVTGCSSHASGGADGGPVAGAAGPGGPTVAPSAPATTATGAAASTPPVRRPVRRCDEATFVPRTSVVLHRNRPTVLYSSRYDLGPAVRATAKGYPLTATTRIRPRVRLDGGGTVPRALERQVLRIGGSALAPEGLPESYDVPLAVENTDAEPRRYLLYAGADVLSGAWRSRFCDRVTAAVARLEGTFTTVGPLHRGVQECGSPPSQDTPLGRVAARRPCR